MTAQETGGPLDEGIRVVLQGSWKSTRHRDQFDRECDLRASAFNYLIGAAGQFSDKHARDAWIVGAIRAAAAEIEQLERSGQPIENEGGDL